MIVSASGRCDIPALYPDWLVSRIQAGYCLVRNPRNPKQIRRVSLEPEDVSAFVFWTKDVQPMIPHLGSLKGYPYYFQYTINGYGPDIEIGMRSLHERIESLKSLSGLVGKERIIWRYDPILLTSNYTQQYHIETFSRIADALSGCFDACIISFIDPIQSTSLGTLGLRQLKTEEMESIALGLGEIANRRNVRLSTCAESMDLEQYGISHAHCIDHTRIEQLSGKKLSYCKDPAQRKACCCTSSVDIGTYNACNLGCIYCYARRNGPHRTTLYNSQSEFLCPSIFL